MKRLIFILTLLHVLSLTALKAHEIRPAYLQIQQLSTTSYEVLWKVPITEGRVLDIYPESDMIESAELISEQLLADARIQQYRWTTKDQLSGTIINFPKLSMSLIDVLLLIEMENDISYNLMAQPESPSVRIPIEPNSWTVVKTYVKLGVEHILLGFDHLLFVLCLVLLIGDNKKLLLTITSFTIAHSITLALSTLGWLALPSLPVEAVIALSIVFLAREYYYYAQGHSSLTAKAPWAVAFIFGLLHGLGFAGALSDIGLPQAHVPLALLFFNLGVELGQVAFILVVMLCSIIFLRIYDLRRLWFQRSIAYAIGGVSSFWLIERLLQF